MTQDKFVAFRDREDAAKRLAKELIDWKLKDPVVLAIPRGGVVLGAVLARELGAALDVVVSRKLRVPMQPELAFGAVGEDGSLVIDHHLIQSIGLTAGQIDREKQVQQEQVHQRTEQLRAIQPKVSLEHRSVVVTDDGIATGATMVAALRAIRTQNPFELIAAIPVAPKKQLQWIRQYCDRVVCLHSPEEFNAVGEFYEVFEPVEDDRVESLLRLAARPTVSG
jgi:putative phosphoribosyl transferase